MNTNPDDPSTRHLDALLAIVRADKPDTARAEYGFETRLVARIADRRTKPALWWAAWSWRLAPMFAVVALSLSLWTHFAPDQAAAEGGTSVLEWSAAAEDDLGSLVLDDFLSPS